MAPKDIEQKPENPEPIDKRYLVEKTLGKGGMAVVYLVRDTVTQRRLALKRLLIKDPEKKQKQVTKFFEHEFHTLSQLAHPRVIEVYDFGKDEIGPYYTMELLDGGDLQQLSPMPWKQVCSLLADICSVLSLLHSRRLIHRDLTPRNVRYTRDLKAKLIDFGTMVPMGPCKQVMGTPAFTAPEVVTLQTLDARSDLYSLGATAYFALTGRHAYAARNFFELRDLWRSKPRPPSTFVPDIPKELDQLVLSLVSLDPIARPVNAAEVMERLSAIALFEIDEQLFVSQAYLSTPMLVGRGEQLLSVRKQMVGVLEKKGGTIFIQSAPGVGRSRFLDACILEAKLLGATVLRADAGDAHVGNWGAVRTMTNQLVEVLPQKAMQKVKPYLSVLGHVLPELLEKVEVSHRARARDSSEDVWLRIPSHPVPEIISLPSNDSTSSSDAQAADSNGDSTPSSTWTEVWGRGYSSMPPRARISRKYPGIELETFSNPEELRPRVHEALCNWLLDISRKNYLLLAIDDIHKIDEPSAAFIALLSRRIYDRKLILAVTAESETSTTYSRAVKLLSQVGTRIELSDLDLSNTEKLLGSVFGQTPHLRLLADRLYNLSSGNPRAIMQLAQHLVNRQTIRYQAGSWILPGGFDSGDLPSSLTEALRERVEKLLEDSRKLAEVMALCPERSLTFDECLLLTDHRDTAQLIKNIDELIASEILSTDGEFYFFSRRSWVPVLTDTLDADCKRIYCLKLAEMFEQGEINDRFRAAQYLLDAGEEERGLDTMVRFAQESKELTDGNPADFTDLLQSLPRNWFESYDYALQLCEKNGRSRKERYILLCRLQAITALTGEGSTVHFKGLLDQLYHECGLGFYDQLNEIADPTTRLMRALQLAQEKYDASPEAERILAPADAIREFARTLIQASSYAVFLFDDDFVHSLPSIEPLTALTPALGVVENTVKSVGAILRARYEEAHQLFLAILERTAQPDRAGLDDAHYAYTRSAVMYGLGLIESNFGFDSALDWAEKIEPNVLHQVNSWRIRMLYYLWQGNAKRADECSQLLELLQIQNSPSQHWEGTHVWREVVVNAVADNLIGVKQTFASVASMAARYPQWVPVQHYANGEYHRIRGDYKSALEAFERALSAITRGRHTVWPPLAGGHLRVLLELGRYDEAAKLGKEHSDFCDREGIGYWGTLIKMPLALAEAKLGHYEIALEISLNAIDILTTLRANGAVLGMAYETCARIAILLKDEEGFHKYATLCSDQYLVGHSSALTAKYDKLIGEARAADVDISIKLPRVGDTSELDTERLFSQIADIFTQCDEPRTRARLSLNILIRHCKAEGGFLYALKEDGPVLWVQSDDSHAFPDMDSKVKAYLAKEIDEMRDTTLSQEDGESASENQPGWKSQGGRDYYPLVLGHHTEDGYAVTGMAVLIMKEKKNFVYPTEAVNALSKSLHEAGDAFTTLAAS
jgi:tetratricopeptide (TPR) repeat protein